MSEGTSASSSMQARIQARMARIRAWIRAWIAKLPLQHIAVLFASTGTFAAGVVLGWNSYAGYLLRKREMDLSNDPNRLVSDADHFVSDTYKVVSIVTAGGYLGALLPMLALLGCRGARAQLAVAYVLLLFIGWLCVCNANTKYTLTMVGRCFSGIGVGIFLTVLPIFIGEIASPRHRDRLLCFAYTALSCGIAVAYAFADTKFEDLPNYNLRCALVCLPMMLCGTMMYLDPVESVANGREDEARTALRLYGSNDETYVNKQMEELRELVKKDVALKPHSYHQLIALLILTLCHQLSGASVVLFNALFLVDLANRQIQKAHLIPLDQIRKCTFTYAEQCQICAFSQILANLLGFLLIGVLGRRTLLCLSGILMATAMGVLGFILETPLCLFYPWLMPTTLAAYYSGYGLGFGPIIWAMLADSFPMSLRLHGASIVASIGWLVSLLLNMYIDSLTEKLATIFWIFAVFSLLGAFVGACFVKETRKKSLLDLQRQFLNS